MNKYLPTWPTTPKEEGWGGGNLTKEEETMSNTWNNIKSGFVKGLIVFALVWGALALTNNFVKAAEFQCRTVEDVINDPHFDDGTWLFDITTEEDTKNLVTYLEPIIGPPPFDPKNIIEGVAAKSQRYPGVAGVEFIFKEGTKCDKPWNITGTLIYEYLEQLELHWISIKSRERI